MYITTTLTSNLPSGPGRVTQLVELIAQRLLTLTYSEIGDWITDPEQFSSKEEGLSENSMVPANLHTN